MPGTKQGQGPSQKQAQALRESAETQNDLLLELVLGQRVNTLHLADISETAHDQEEVELDTN